MLSSQVMFSANRQMGRQTPVKQYAPNISIGGIKKDQGWERNEYASRLGKLELSLDVI